MMYKQIDCPHCGNSTTAKSIDEPQKCKWCRRLFKVTITKRNKDGKKAKFNWDVEPVDFPDDGLSRVRSLFDYSYDDIYGSHKK